MTAPAADLAGRTCVVCVKHDGSRRVFACYRDPREAEAVARRFREFGAKVDLQPEQQQEVVR